MTSVRTEITRPWDVANEGLPGVAAMRLPIVAPCCSNSPTASNKHKPILAQIDAPRCRENEPNRLAMCKLWSGTMRISSLVRKSCRAREKLDVAGFEAGSIRHPGAPVVHSSPGTSRSCSSDGGSRGTAPVQTRCRDQNRRRTRPYPAIFWPGLATQVGLPMVY